MEKSVFLVSKQCVSEDGKVFFIPVKVFSEKETALLFVKNNKCVSLTEVPIDTTAIGNPAPKIQELDSNIVQ